MDNDAGGNVHLTKFGVGQPVPRNEDPRLLRGDGRYTDDVSMPGEVHAAVRRSDVASGRLLSVDATTARAMPGVLAVITAGDLEDRAYGLLLCKMPLKGRDGSALIVPPRPSLAQDRVVHVGESIAVVVAETLALAKDAAEAIEVEIEGAAAVVEPEAALEPGAPQLHAMAPGNVALDWGAGDREAVRARFRRRPSRHPHQAPQQPHRHRLHGAARCHRRLRQRQRAATRFTSAAKAFSGSRGAWRTCSALRRTRSGC